MHKIFMNNKLRKILRQIGSAQKGATLLYFALIIPVFVGFAGLGFDATLWFMEKRQLQSVADSSAIAAAYAVSKDLTAEEVLLAATNDAETNSFYNTGGKSIQVITPPTSGKFSGMSNYVMVAVSMPAARYFSRIIGANQSTIATKATAGIISMGEHCILALDETRDRALEFSGTSNVDINCGVSSNSSSSEAIYLNGTATLTANPSAQAYGDIYQGNNATLDTPNPLQPFSQRSPDPYGPSERNLQVPSSPVACTMTNLSVGKNDPAPVPGRYCGGLTFGAQANVTLSPGVYIIDGGDFLVRGGATITGTGITIILTATDPANIGSIKINGGANMNISAPTSGTWMGVAFFQDPRAIYANGSNDFLGGANMNIQGAVYIPSQEIGFSGGSESTSGCLQLVGAKVTFSGNSFLYNDYADCDSMGVEKISRTIVKLEE
ncbi:MAG: hypothetical protein K9G26_02020 [Emcibacter sp.]|nr:hypothetical protein [Emcibacter sp.]